MKAKTRVAVLFGGRSAEHEVSLQSARNVIDAIDKDRYETVLIGIDRQGAWYLNNGSIPLLNSNNAQLTVLNKSSEPVSLIAGDKSGVLINPERPASMQAIDVLFPVLHGPFGEDGSVQGLAKLANVACVGSDILGSAIGMDKDISKRLLRDAGIQVAGHIALRRGNLSDQLAGQVEQAFGFPVYVKPANMGSSVGVVRVSRAVDLSDAVNNALQYDSKILIEQEIIGRELECAVLGNDDPIASTVGEIVTDDGFYSYEKKYIDEDAAVLKIPAELEDSTLEQIKVLSIAAFRVLEIRGMARVDMFLAKDDNLYINEVNTIPGFTSISMYPKLWQASGILYKELIDRLIKLAFEEHQNKGRLISTGY
jgi:D-alanine-D-alanine ligase